MEYGQENCDPTPAIQDDLWGNGEITRYTKWFFLNKKKLPGFICRITDNDHNLDVKLSGLY